MASKNMLEWYIGVLKAYAVFNGRARRAEYWYFVLANSIVAVLLNIIFVSILGRISSIFVYIPSLYFFAVLVPYSGATIRRLHDTGKSGWWMFVPFYNIYLLAIDGTHGENRYGPNPKGL